MVMNPTSEGGEPSAGGERGARVRFPPPLVFALSTLTGVALQHFARGIHIPVARSTSVAVGVAVLVLAIALVASARVWFLRTGQSPVPWKPTPSLIAQGPYRFTRNPMYVGVTLIQVGLGVALDNAWISLLAPISLVLVHRIAVVPEEAYLADKFGAAYETYRARVRRYL